MVDVRFPAPWIFEKRFKRLSGDATKLFLFAYGYSVFNEMEGRIPDDDLTEIPGVNLAAIQELAAAGLWTRDGDAWLLDRYGATQSSLAELAAASRARELARERKVRQRIRERGDPDHNEQPRDPMSRVTSQERKGKDRTGVEVGATTNSKDPDEDWPAVTPIGAGLDPDPPKVPQQFGIFARKAAEADSP